MRSRKPGLLRRGLQRFTSIGLLFAILRHRLHPETVFCLGDSHVTVFNWLEGVSCTQKTNYFWPYMVKGATALGLANPNSRTNALERFRFVIKNIPKGSPVLLMLGEVDCGYLIWYLSQRDKKPAEEVYKRALTNYIQFLDEIRVGNLKLIITGAPLPTIRDGINIGEIANARRDVRASRKERTELTLRWNAALKEYALKYDLDFVDTDRWLLDPETREIRETFMNSNPEDHHLEPMTYALALALGIYEMGKMKCLPTWQNEWTS